MINIIKSFISDEDYYVIIVPKSVYIKGYNRLININENEVIIEIDSKLCKILGNNFSLIKSENKELQINGTVESFIKL